MIAVFKTDVKGIRQAKKLVAMLLSNLPLCRVNFDLDDCDKILRVEGAEYRTNRIVELLKLNGHNCEVLSSEW